MVSHTLRRLAASILTPAIGGFVAGAAQAQAPSTPPLPPLQVQAPPKAKAKAKAKQSKAPVAAAAPAAGPPATAAAVETGVSPVRGFVAGVTGTATKTDTPILETPQSISVVTRDQMDQQAAQSVKEALQYTAGVAADTRTAFGGYDIMYSRGFILDKYLDGLKYLGGLAYTAPQMELYGLERLEVLLGPASMLYGASSLGGILNAISKRPTDDPFREVELIFGNRGRMQAAFDVGGPIDADKTWTYRLTGLARGVDSQVDFNKEERYWIAPAITWKVAPGTTVTVFANLQHDPFVGLYNQIPSYGSVIPDPNGTIPRNRFLGEPTFNTNTRDQQSVGYAIESRLDDIWTVRQNLRYLHTDGVVQQFLPYFMSGPTTLERYTIDQKTSIGAFTVDNNAQAKFWTGPLRHTLLFGIDYTNYVEKNDVDTEFGTPIDIFNPVYGNVVISPLGFINNSNQVLNQTGIYVQDQIKLDRFILTVGGREDLSSISSSIYMDDHILAPSTVNSTQDDRAFTKRIGLTYLLGGGVAPYAVYATSFQPTVGTTATGTPFVPTTGELYEVGIKYQPPGIKALFTLAAYDLTQQNVLTPDPAQPAFLVQTGEVRSRGFEAEAKMSLSERVDVIASYTRTDAVVTKANPVTGTVGKHPVNIPDQTAALWGFYKMPYGPLAGLGFGGGVRYVGASAGDDVNSFFVPDYTLFDAAISYDFGENWRELRGMKLQVNVSNLFDRTYVSECSNDVTCVYGNGRTVITSLKYRW